jgi:hypothetical protein
MNARAFYLKEAMTDLTELPNFWERDFEQKAASFVHLEVPFIPSKISAVAEARA